MTGYHERKDEIFDWCRERLLEDEEATTPELYSAACDRWPELEDLSHRQFNARYVLQVKRRISRELEEREKERQEEERLRRLEGFQERAESGALGGSKDPGELRRELTGHIGQASHHTSLDGTRVGR